MHILSMRLFVSVMVLASRRQHCQHVYSSMCHSPQPKTRIMTATPKEQTSDDKYDNVHVAALIRKLITYT